MNIIVTGATGFIGRHLIPTLLGKGYNVLTINRDINKANLLFGNYNNCINTDLHDVNKIFQFGPDIVIHLAAMLTSKDDYDIIDSLLEANIVFGTKLLSILSNCNNLKLFINTGSFAEYSMGPGYVENAYLYTATKTAYKQILKFYAHKNDYNYINVIPYTIYGGHDSQKKIMDLLKDSFEVKEPIKMSPGEQILDFIHIDDVVSFYSYIIEHITTFVESNNTTYHLGTGIGTSIKTLASMLENKYDKKCNVKWGGLNYRKNDVMYAVAPQSINIKIGWKPIKKLIDSI